MEVLFGFEAAAWEQEVQESFSLVFSLAFIFLVFFL
jgi:hypothetical protein